MVVNTSQVTGSSLTGVARVTVGAVSLGGQQWLENVTATAHDSVAVLEMNTPGSRFDGLAHTAAQMTWFDAHGAVIKRVSTAMQE